MDRKIIESLRKLQALDGLSEEEFYLKKQALMRKLTQKATAFLYEKEPKKEKWTLKEMAAKKEKDNKLQRASVTKSQESSIEATSQKTNKSRSRKGSSNTVSNTGKGNSTMNVMSVDQSAAASIEDDSKNNSESAEGPETESDVDELKELQMRTGLVKTKVSALRMPSLKKPENKRTVSKKNTITFADAVMKTGDSSVNSQV